MFGSVLALLLGLAGVFLWLKTPFVQDKEFLSKLHDDARRERENLRLKALDEQENGFLHPELVKVWQTQSGQTHELPGPLKRWVESSSSTIAEERRAALSVEQYDSARSYLNALHEAFQKPYFLSPGVGDEIGVANLAVLKECCSPLVREMEYFAAQKDYQSMSVPMVSMFKLGNRLRETSSATNAAIGTLLPQYAVETAMIAIPPQNDLSADDLRILAGYVGSYLPPEKKEVDDIMRQEYGQTSLALHSLLEENPDRLQEREVRRYDNAIIELLQTGKTGDDTLVATFQAFKRSAEFYRRRQQAFGVALGAQAYRAKFGETPAIIEQLAAANVDYPDPSEQQRIGLQYQDGSVTVQLPEMSESELELWNRAEPAGSGWYEIRGKQMVFPSHS